MLPEDMSNSPGGGGSRECPSPSSTASSTNTTASGSVLGSVGSVGSGNNGGCRNSGASFDSGRATSSTTFQGVRYSAGGLSSESSLGSFRHSYHSSNSSLGSIPSEEIRNFDVANMISQGVPDHEILNAWLTGIHLECYYQNFMQAGYDMHTISRMTPEDLNAIGVTKPHHRKRIKSEISQLNISQGLPEHIPESLEEWLRLLRLDDYLPRLLDQGYRNVRQVTNITWEDLDDIGILKLGHQKKFMLAIKRVQDIVSGKRIPTSSSSSPSSYITPNNAYVTADSQFQLSHQPQLRHLNSSSMPYPHPQLQHHHHHPNSPHSTASSPHLTTPPSVNNSSQQDNNSSCNNSPYLVDPRHQIVRNMWPHQSSSSVPPYQPAASSVPSPSSPHSLQQQQQGLSTTTNNAAISHRIQVHHQPPLPLQPGPLHERLIFNNQGGGAGMIQVHNQSQAAVIHHQQQQQQQQQALYHPEVISIRVKNGHANNSLDSPPEEEPIYGTSSFLPNPTGGGSSSSFNNSAAGGPPTPNYRNRNNSGGCGFKSYEEGETSSPTTSSGGGGPPGVGGSNLSMTKQSMSNTWTLPRLQKHKPISKVMGGGNNCDSSSAGVSYPINPGPFAPQQLNHPLGPVVAPPSVSPSSGITATFAKCSVDYGSSGSVLVGGKGQPPPPPRRSSCSSLGPSSSSAEDNNLPLPPPPPPQQQLHNGIDAHPQQQQHLNNGRPTPPINESYKNMYGMTSNNYYTQQQQQQRGSNNMNSFPPSNALSNGPSNIGGRRSTLPLTKSRDTSPGGGSDFSDSTDLNLQSNGFLCKGVRRNGSDASFKSNSSTESESIPFANDNAGTIKQQKPAASKPAMTTHNNNDTATGDGDQQDTASNEDNNVLSDIGSMLADLTDQLDAILEQERTSKH